MKAFARSWVALTALAAAAILFALPLGFTGFFAYVTGGDDALALWDSTDSQGGSWNVFAYGSPQGGGPNSTTTARFYANYTALADGLPINGTGVECNISFNEGSGWSAPEPMAFNASSGMYEHYRSFQSRGFFPWNSTCDGSGQGYDVLSATDNLTVTNTPAGIYVPLDAETCYEDSACAHDFAADCYDIDDVDEGNLTYGYKAGTGFPGFAMNNVTGGITVGITTDAGCGDFLVTLLDKDSTGWGATADMEFVVNAVNDKPVLGNVPVSANQNSTYYRVVTATDEETPAGPFLLNMSFVSCYRPFNSEHANLTECSALFSMNGTGTINRTAIFSNKDVGTYSINFTATDKGDNLTGTSIPPYAWLANSTGWQVATFTVVDLNDQPIIEPVPNQFWAQKQNVTLVLYASDIDNGTLVFNATTLYRNLSAYVNRTLFPITLNQTVFLDNGTSLGNATMNYTPVINGQVGNYTVNLSVYDGRVNGTYSVLANFSVTNVNDPPNLSFSCRNYSVQGLNYSCNAGINTTDPDNFPAYVPYADGTNGTVAFGVGFAYCSKTFNASDTNCSIFGINQTTGIIVYADPLRKDAGNYTVNVSATDGGGLVTWTLFNFTVIADDAPAIAPVPPQLLSQNSSFYLEINATDSDNATDNLTFRSDTYFNGSLLGSTKFPIANAMTLWPPGPAMGIMNYSSVNNSQVGNYTVRITANDTWGREDSVYVNFTVQNLNDPPALNFSCANYTSEHTYYQPTRYECLAGQNSSDIDQLTPAGESIAYNFTLLAGFPFFEMNSTTGLLNFSAWNDSWANGTLNYTYVLNVTMADAAGLTDSRLLNITVYAVNDPPVFNFTNTTADANGTFFENLSAEASDEEGNYPFFYNITIVNCTKANVSDANCSVFGVNESTGIVSFYVPAKDVGNYTMNVSVADNGSATPPAGAAGWALVGFRILSPNHAPGALIAGIIPSDTFYENDTVFFAYNATDADGDDLECTWYRNATQIGSADNCQYSSSFTYVPGFDESGDWNITLEVTDTKATSSAQRTVAIMNRNRPPEIIYPIQNQSWNMNTQNRNLVLSYNFQDPDNENSVTNDDNNLTVNYTRPEHISVLVDDGAGAVTIPAANWTGKGIVSLTPDADWFGIEYIVFTLNDSSLAASSNNISLNVSFTETQTQTIIQQSTGGGASTGPTGTKIASLTITVAPFERITSYNRTSAAVNFRNSGEVDLKDIRIDAYVKESNEILTSLSAKSIAVLGVGGSANTTLSLTTFQLTKETYAIRVTGSVTDPKFNQSTTIYIKPIFNETKLEEKLRFVKDLFEDNPECIDLMELVVQAEREVTANNVEKAKELTEAALDNCRDIIRYSNATKRKVTPDADRIPLNEMIIAFLGISLIAILVYLVAERRHESGRAKKERRI